MCRILLFAGPVSVKVVRLSRAVPLGVVCVREALIVNGRSARIPYREGDRVARIVRISACDPWLFL